MVKLIDPTFLWVEAGRGSGKTSHMLAPRMDRIQNDMQGAELVLAAATYKSIIDNLLPGILEYFLENYERGVYFEFGKEPPEFFGVATAEFPDRSRTSIEKTASWGHTISFVTGTVIRFVSADRPESMLGINAAHLFVDEMLRIPGDKFVERIIPALRADRSKWGHSHYFMGMTGFSSTPNFETDEDWFTKFEENNMSTKLQACIVEMGLAVDKRMHKLLLAQSESDTEAVKKHQRFVNRWTERLNKVSDIPEEKGFRYGQTLYLRASSFSNLKILGMDYIRNQIKSIKDSVKLDSSIFSIRKYKVKDMFFARFGKEHLFEDGYTYKYIDNYSIEDEKKKCDITSRDLKYCNPNQPLIVGYDAGPFSSLIFAQEEKTNRVLRVLKDMWVITPNQQDELAEMIDSYFKHHRRKEIFLYYDRAANQRNPEWRKHFPELQTLQDSDANLLYNALLKRGWMVHLLSKGQGTIYYPQHYRLLSLVFGKTSKWRILIDRNECEALVSSINHSPIKRKEDMSVELDKSSERKLDYEDQAFYSTQLSSAFMYLIWGKFNHLLPSSDRQVIEPQGVGTYTVKNR